MSSHNRSKPVTEQSLKGEFKRSLSLSGVRLQRRGRLASIGDDGSDSSCWEGFIRNSIVSISSALIVRSSRLLEGLRSFSAVVAAKSIAAITKVWLSLS